MGSRFNLFSTRDTMGLGDIGESLVKKKKIKETRKIQDMYNKKEIDRSDYKRQARDIRKI